MVAKISIFWDVIPCSWLKVNRYFGEHVASIFRVKTNKACYLLHAGFLLALFFDLEDGGNMFL
jgi:hypothetical protein